MKIKHYFYMAMAALVMTNCSQEEELQDIQQGLQTLTATIEGGSSRSAVTDGGIFSWTSGDAISVWNGSSYQQCTYSGSGNNFSNAPSNMSGYAIYPHGSHPTYNGSGLPKVNLESSYTYGSTNAIMLAKVQGSSRNLSFNHLGGLMRFTIKNIPSDASSFTFTANTGITGDFQVQTENGANVIKTTTVSSSNKSVTINFTANSLSNGTGTFYVPLPVGTYTGFTIKIGNKQYVSEATNAIKRRTLLLMPTFTCSDAGLVKGGNSFKLENAQQEMNVGGNESLVIETPASGTSAQLTLNCTPENNNSTLNISDGQTGASDNSKAKVVVNVTNSTTVSELNIDAPTLTVELASGTYDEITAKTAKQTLIIRKGVKVKKLKVIGGNVDIKDGAVVESRTALRVLTFEDEDAKFGPLECKVWDNSLYSYDYRTINKWSDYIPTDKQYGGGHGGYEWYDKKNTELTYKIDEDAMFAGYGGHAGISNYVGSDWENIGLGYYPSDLQAYNVTGGHSGTNFNTHFGYLDDSGYGMMTEMVYFEFGDGKARVIDHMWVTNTTYVYNQLHVCTDFGKNYALGDTSTYKIVAYGYESESDTAPTTTEFYLLNTGGRFVTEWTKWDLSVLGKVVKVKFNLVGSADMNGSYGLVIPAYFAYDDVAVQFTE